MILEWLNTQGDYSGFMLLPDTRVTSLQWSKTVLHFSSSEEKTLNWKVACRFHTAQQREKISSSSSSSLSSSSSSSSSSSGSLGESLPQRSWYNACYVSMKTKVHILSTHVKLQAHRQSQCYHNAKNLKWRKLQTLYSGLDRSPNPHSGSCCGRGSCPSMWLV